MLTPIDPITKRSMKFLFTKKIMNKYDVAYFISEESGLIMTESPYWLDEAYSTAIATTDVGLVSRNLSLSVFTSIFLNLFNLRFKNIVDVSGGYGLMTRILRDRGFACYWEDPYCQNLFAQGFESENTSNPIDALLCFEVLEHIQNPVDFVKEKFEKYKADIFIFTTYTFEGDLPDSNWWYYSFETGQHICFYNDKSIRLLAKELGVYYYNINECTHVFSKSKLSKIKINLIKNRRIRTLLNFIFCWIFNGRSLLNDDYQKKIKELNENSLR